MHRMITAPRLAVLALLVAAGPGHASPAGTPAEARPSTGSTTPPGSAAPSASDAATPTATEAPASAPLGINEARAANGLVLSADLRGEYVSGFPMLVTITVRNDTAGPLAFPDLAARPWLVRFFLKNDRYKWERFNTPPANDPATTWTIAPRTQRQVTLEIPSSGGMDPGNWELAVTVKDPAGELSLASRPIKLAAAKPVGGGYVWEPTIQQAVGAMIPWVQAGATGHDLYLLQLAPKSSARVVGQFHLARLPARVDPILSRARASDAAARYIYWASSPQAITLARLQGTTLRGKLRTVSLPYPKVELLGRGATDAKGGVVIPLWVPNPSGSSGAVYALCVDDRGAQTLREVTRLPARPATVATAVDAASNLLLALGHAAAVDLYRVDPTLPAAIGARGARVAALSDGWTPGALAFDTLPDKGERPGGLALLSVLTRPGETASYRALWADLAGRTIEETAPLPWTAPGAITMLAPAGYGPFYYLTRDAAGASWYGAQADAPRKLDVDPGVLWLAAGEVRARRMVPGTVFADQVLGPAAQ